jgi:hypothetical protein
MYEKVYTALQPLTFPVSYEQLSHFVYNKMWDAITAWSGDFGAWFRIFHDGSFARYGVGSGSWVIVPRVGGLPSFVSVYATSDGTVYGSYEVNGLPNLQEVLNPEFKFTSGTGYYPGGSSLALVDDVNQVFVWRVNTNRFDVRSLRDGSLIRSVNHNLNTFYDQYAWAAHGQLCAIKVSNGRVLFFDYLGDEGILEAGSVEPCRLATYDCLCKVLLTYGTDNKVRVYVRNAVPAILSNPAFTTTPVYGARVHQVSVRLTGLSGEPCVDWWVHWGLDPSAGIGPYGFLEKFISQTDENGYAWNNYFGPCLGETGATVIKAWVEA